MNNESETIKESLIKNDDQEQVIYEIIDPYITKKIESLSTDQDAFNSSNIFSKIFFWWAFRLISVI